MKRYFPLVFAAAVLFIVAGSASAQKVGGFKTADVEAADVQEAASFAIEAQAEKSGKEIVLDEVLKAETQVVAGRNYRICMRVNSEAGEGQDDVSIVVQAVVYVDLKGNKKLSSWAISECGE
ncbi:MAG TPA: cystatin domain-containing protein [Pyrinomonadaceae bacterium]|nr:cystatin domain-containing protein [Pyrinomonadaceae bacterium]